MNKNFKKVLSYTLGAILALGVGFSYAYAVGANDSNAFVTKTEWNAKVAQLEATLDNITKTINDTNMDFVMNGPRLQASLVEGFENSGGVDTNLSQPFVYSAHPTWNHQYNYFQRISNICLQDTWNGRQGIAVYTVYGADLNGSEYQAKCKFALRSNEDPNIYLVYTYFYVDVSYSYLSQVYYVDISKETQTYTSAKTLSVTVSTDEWGRYSGSIVAMPRTSSNIATSTALNGITGDRHPNSGNNSPTYNGLANPGTGWVTIDLVGKEATITYEFPATSGGMRNYSSNNSFNLFPKDLKGRKYGTVTDYLNTGSAGAGIYRVYSPQKGCHALKSYLNGEIPIFN